MTTTQVKDTKRGELVRIGKSVYVRDEYLRDYQRYVLTPWNNISGSRRVEGTKIVEIGFTF